MSMLTVFAQYRSLLDQLPERGFYVFFLKHGYSMILPMKAVDTLEEAQAVPERPEHTKVILDGKKPYRLWFIGVPDFEGKFGLTLVSEHGSRDELDLKLGTSPAALEPSGPGVPMVH